MAINAPSRMQLLGGLGLEWALGGDGVGHLHMHMGNGILGERPTGVGVDLECV